MIIFMVESIYQCTINKSIHFTIVLSLIFSFRFILLHLEETECVYGIAFCHVGIREHHHHKAGSERAICLLFPRWKNVLKNIAFLHCNIVGSNPEHNEQFIFPVFIQNQFAQKADMKSLGTEKKYKTSNLEPNARFRCFRF